MHTYNLDDGMDDLYSVENSGANAGQVRVTGILDRESDITHTVNIRVMLHKHVTKNPGHFISLIPSGLSCCYIRKQQCSECCWHCVSDSYSPRCE